MAVFETSTRNKSHPIEWLENSLRKRDNFIARCVARKTKRQTNSLQNQLKKAQQTIDELQERLRKFQPLLPSRHSIDFLPMRLIHKQPQQPQPIIEKKRPHIEPHSNMRDFSPPPSHHIPEEPPTLSPQGPSSSSSLSPSTTPSTPEKGTKGKKRNKKKKKENSTSLPLQTNTPRQPAEITCRTSLPYTQPTSLTTATSKIQDPSNES